MKLVYSVKIEHEGKIITGLISPQLRMDFIKRYIKYIDPSIELSSTSMLLLPEKFELKTLQIVMEEYIENLLHNHYVLRSPDSLYIEQKGGEHWINPELSVSIVKSRCEQFGEGFGILLFLVTLSLNEFTFVLASRINNVPYTTLIVPVIADFTMAGIIYAYSGATSNIVSICKNLDDLIQCKKKSLEEIQLEEKHPFCSSYNLAKFVLCILPLSCATFSSFTYWQTMMALHDKFESSNSDDPIITPKFIYNLAIVSTVIGAIYSVAQLTSFSFKVIPTLKMFLDRCYTSGKRLKKDYCEVLTNEEQAEQSEGDDMSVVTPVASSSFGTAKQAKENDLITFFITGVVYNNLLINQQDFLYEVKQIGGIKAVQNIINLGEDSEIANIIVEHIDEYGIKYIANILFGDVETFALSDTEITVDKTIEQNFFLNTEQGIKFIHAVANSFDKETLLKILELGQDQEIAEQILIEAEEYGANRVIAMLLGKELPVEGYTDNLENIIGTQELSRLQLVSNGIFNGWSNRVYHKVVEYIDNLAKNLDDLLNTGKSGNQVAVTLALLEEWLGFAASGGQRFGGRPYYNPADNDDDWLYGDGGSSDGNNNSSAGNFDNQNGFTGLTLPSYNGTDYNITDHQM